MNNNRLVVGCVEQGPTKLPKIYHSMEEIKNDDKEMYNSIIVARSVAKMVTECLSNINIDDYEQL